MEKYDRRKMLGLGNEKLKRASIPVSEIPLTQATRAATVARDVTPEGKLRGVNSNESMEMARERYAKEDGMPYNPPAKKEEAEWSDTDLELYEKYPEMREILLNDRRPQSVMDNKEPKAPIDIIEGEGINIEGVYDFIDKTTGDDKQPVEKSESTGWQKNLSDFSAGYTKQAEANAKDTATPMPKQQDVTSLYKTAAPVKTAMQGLEEQAKNILMKKYKR